MALVSASKAVRCINQEILGMSSPNNLISQTIPQIGLIREANYQPGRHRGPLDFTVSPRTTGRLGIFAAKKNNQERGVMMLLPASGTPNRVLICITQGFEQAAKALIPFGWGGDPLAPAMLQFALLKHVVNRWGPQMLASRKEMALMYIVRAKGKELGPFANDGLFVKETLRDIAELTEGAFGFDAVEAFTFSSGISDFNIFVPAIASHLSVKAVYAIDPPNAQQAVAPAGAVRRQFSRSANVAGFDCLPVEMWANEANYPTRQTFPHPWPFNYMHNHCMPMYALHLGIQTS